jgi:hypothetical protein
MVAHQRPLTLQSRTMIACPPSLCTKRYNVICHHASGLQPDEADAWIVQFASLSASDCATVFEAQAASRRGTGPKVNFGTNEHVGTLRAWDSFVSYVVRPLGGMLGISPAEFDDIQFALPPTGSAYLADPPFSSVLEEARRACHSLAGNVAWLWRNATRGDDPTAGLTPTHLPRQLGLPNFKVGRRYIGLTVSTMALPVATMPLIFDCHWGGLPYWWPGGRTRPIADGAPAGSAIGPDDGLEEVVVYGATYASVKARSYWLVAE